MFKKGKLDPREVILSIEELYWPLRSALIDHLVPNYKQGSAVKFQLKNSRKEIQQKDCKQLEEQFKALTANLAKEINRDPESLAEYSDSNERYGKVLKDKRPLLRDILPFVQTARLILMIEDKQNGIDRISDLFRDSLSKDNKNTKLPLRLLEHELDEHLKAKIQTRNVILYWCRAMFQEHKQQYREALKTW